MTLVEVENLLTQASSACKWCGDFLLLPDADAFQASRMTRGSTAADCNCTASRDAMISLRKQFRAEGISS